MGSFGAVWDEEFRFPVYDKEGEKQKLNLCVYAKESGEDDSLGEGEVPLEKWKDNEFDGASFWLWGVQGRRS